MGQLLTGLVRGVWPLLLLPLVWVDSLHKVQGSQPHPKRNTPSVGWESQPGSFPEDSNTQGSMITQTEPPCLAAAEDPALLLAQLSGLEVRSYQP